jgi:predicted peptidase
VTQVREAYRGDPDRTYLTGFSFGGNGVLDLPLVQRDFWAALWPVDPTRVPTSDPGRPLWLSFGEVSRRRKEAFIRALNLTHAGASAHGNRLYLDEGQDHVSSAELAYRDEKIYSWLLSKSLASAV